MFKQSWFKKKAFFQLVTIYLKFQKLNAYAHTEPRECTLDTCDYNL